MKYYKQYMDRQALSPEFLEKLQNRRPRPKSHWRQWAALAACCVLLAGVGAWTISRPVKTPPVQMPQVVEPVPEKEKIFVLPQLAFRDNTVSKRDSTLDDVAAPAPLAPEPALAPSQYEPVSQAQVAEPFGGEIPEILGWGDCEILSRAGEADDSCLYVSGQAQDFSFDLAVQEGEIPDLASEGGEITQVCGVDVAGVKQAEDTYEISFMTPEGSGVFYRVKGEDGPERASALVWALLAPKGD